MTRYGELMAVFVAADDPTHTAIAYGGISSLTGITRAEVTKKLGAMTRGRFTLLKSTNWDKLVVEGRICGLSQTNGVLSNATGVMWREMGMFLVQSVRETLGQDGRQEVEVTGLGPEHLLTKAKRWSPVGEETVITTELEVASPAPHMTTVANGAPPGNDAIRLANKGWAEKGDELRLTMDDDNVFVATIRNPAPSGVEEGYVQFDPRLPLVTNAGNAAEIRKCKLYVADATGMAVGQQIHIDIAGEPNHASVITTVDLGEPTVTVRDGLPQGAIVGSAVQAFDFSEPALDDVTQIMSGAPQWTAVFDTFGAAGTAEGTAQAPYGESVWDMLIAVSEQTGEMFRLGALSGGFGPRKRIFWFRNNDSSGVTLYLRALTEDVNADTESVNRGVIHSLARERSADIITRVYPLSGDGRIDLEYVSDEAKVEAATQGFSIVISEDLFRPDYIEYGVGVSEPGVGVLEGTFRFGNISLKKKASLAEMRAASDAMLRQAMTVIKESQRREYWRVKCQVHKPLYPGQSIVIHNQTNAAPTNPGTTYYILEVTDSYDVKDGVIKTSLLVSTVPLMQVDGVVKMGRELKATAMEARRRSLIEDGDAGGTVVSGGGGGGGDHGGLTGLTDDDHPQYLRTDGTRVLVGDMAVAEGKKIDGVDVSAHAADAAAHHAPVTAGDGSIAVVGQAVALGAGAAGAGLSLVGGALGVNAAAMVGTVVSNDFVGVAVEGVGGLEVAAGGVRVKRPLDSGIGASVNGLWLAPATVGAASVNGVSGTTHTHLVLAFADTKASPGQLMKATAEGDHALRWLTADKVRTGLIDTAAGALTLDPAGALVNVDGDLTFTGVGRWVRTAAGELTLAPVGELHLDPVSNVVELQPTTTLKTAHWSTGFLGMGWGVTYDGHLDARSIHADELIVMTFIADAARVRVGSLWVTPGAALLAENFTIPSVGVTGAMIVEDAPGHPNLMVFDENDWVMLRLVDRSGGGLKAVLAWGQVKGYVDGPGEGQQTWTWTTRSTTSAGQVVGGGDEVLGFAKSGAGWIHATTTDAVGAPYLGVTTWQGSNPYDEVNRTHWLRMGQLRGVTGAYEWGLQAGAATSRRVRFSDLVSEIHGSRLSLYAGDGAQLRVAAVEVRLYRDATNYSTLVPNADHGILNVISSGGGLFYATIDEGVGSYSTTDYVANDLNTSGSLVVGLTDPTPWGAIYGAQVRAAVVGNGFSNDTVRLFGQVFAADGLTPLTSEKALYSMTGNTTVVVSPNFEQVDTAATQAAWNGARLRLRWEYVISSSEEAIRLDPQVPSIAVGMGLPTGYEGGGDGFWVGADAGVYKLRLGKAAGVGLRWTGTAVELRNSAGLAAITLGSDGTSEFTRPMTLGALGGIWQGTGSFDAPQTGLKLFNSAGIGRLRTYSGGVVQVEVDSLGQLATGGGSVVLNSSGLRLASQASESQATINYYQSGTNYARYFSVATPTSAITGLRSWRPGNVVNTGYLALHTNSTEGDKIQLAIASAAGVTNQVEVLTTSTDLHKGARVDGGILLGNRTEPAAPVGVLRIKQRADSNVTPTTTQVDIFAVTVGGVQKLYAKFGNGVVRELASA